MGAVNPSASPFKIYFLNFFLIFYDFLRRPENLFLLSCFAFSMAFIEVG